MFDLLDEACLDGVLLSVYTDSAVVTQEDAIIDAHIIRAIPSTVKAVLIVVI